MLGAWLARDLPACQALARRVLHTSCDALRWIQDSMYVSSCVVVSLQLGSAEKKNAVEKAMVVSA